MIESFNESKLRCGRLDNSGWIGRVVRGQQSLRELNPFEVSG
jgi:hypothetical protein